MALLFQCNSIKSLPWKRLSDCVSKDSVTGRSRCTAVCGRCTVLHTENYITGGFQLLGYMDINHFNEALAQQECSSINCNAGMH